MTRGEHHTPAARRAISKGIKKARSAKKRSEASKASWARRKALKEGPRTEPLHSSEANPVRVAELDFSKIQKDVVDRIVGTTVRPDNFTEAYIKLTREYFADVRALVDDLEQQTLGGHR